MTPTASTGPEFTTTQGNNAHAYSDRDNNNQPDPGSEAQGGPTLQFDFIADYFSDQPQSYTDATVTNLFYWCNMVHDLTYQYGFNEIAGNFQVSNYGRGGVGGDDVRCEAQDGSGTNNANFSTPAADGGRPRMQMFLWPGLQFGMPSALTVDAPSTAAGTYGGNYARFTPAPTAAGLERPDRPRQRRHRPGHRRLPAVHGARGRDRAHRQLGDHRDLQPLHPHGERRDAAARRRW